MNKLYDELGKEMYSWAVDLYPICRSLTGAGNRETLEYIKKVIPELETHSVKTGYKAFDWVVPNEWNIQSGYIEDLNSNRIIDFVDSNLHIMGYSEPVDKTITIEELEKHLYSIPSEPNAIPYKTSYYKKNGDFV